MYLSRLTVRGFRASAEAEIEAHLPGRFSVLVGANSAGKTTVADAMYLGHQSRFPYLPAMSAAALGVGGRGLAVEYSYEQELEREGALGRRLQIESSVTDPGGVAAYWTRSLERRMGSIRAVDQVTHPASERVKLLYLPAWRNPLDELARREARILVELLRAQQQRLTGSRNLTSLRMRAHHLLEQLTTGGLVGAVEDRVEEHLSALSAGVRRQWGYVGGQVVDDTYLARVLELMLAALEGRANAQPLEVSGLGYVNLLHIAVTLAAVPDLEANAKDGPQPAPAGEAVRVPVQAEETSDVDEARDALRQARTEQESQEDSFFPSSEFHATIVIEEPEAHLHPQLQHSLVRYLRRVVNERPELQVVLSTHATDIITSCDPAEVVVLRRLADGRRVCRPIANLPQPEGEKAKVLRMTRLHLDASRSASLFAERLALVEGITDAIVLRELGRSWAGDQSDRQAFVDALSIVPVGTKVGHWPVQLLATRDYELCSRLAILRDSDVEPVPVPAPATWMAEHDPGIARMFQSQPTLEPSLASGNEDLLKGAAADVGLTLDQASTPEVTELFRSARAAKKAKPDGTPAQDALPAGVGAKKKAEFALALAARLMEANQAGTPVHVPEHISALFDFLYEQEGPAAGSSAEDQGEEVAPPAAAAAPPTSPGEPDGDFSTD